MPDLNNMTQPGARVASEEIYSPTNAWSGAPSRIYVAVHRLVGGIFQLGYDPATGRHWVRRKAWDGGGWSTWKAADGGSVTDPPAPLYARLNGNKLVEINFSLLLDPTSVPANTQFTVKVNAASQTLASVGINGASCLVETSSAMGAGTTTVSYVVPASNKLRSVDAVDVLAFTDFAVSA